MKRYEKYKNSGIEWIGEIPEHWSMNQLRYFGNGFCNGTTAQQIDFPTEYKVTRIETISTGEINLEKVGYISKEDYNEVYKLKKYDILVSHINSYEYVGNCAQWKNDDLLIHGMNLIRISPNKNIFPKYFLWLLKDLSFRHSIRSICKPAINQVSVTTTALKSIKATYPPEEEQIAIANYLGCKTAEIDDLIAKKEQLLTLYEEEKTAIINQAVTGKLKIKNEKLKMKDSGIDWLGEIPEHWDVKKLKYQVKINKETLSDKTDEQKEIQYIDISNVEYGKLKEPPRILSFKEAPSRARRIVHSGDTIISTVRTYLKAILFIENASENLIASTGFAIISPDKKILPVYLFYILSSEIILQNITASSVGVSYPAINASDIGYMHAWYPSLEEQSTIVKYIEKETARIDTKIKKTKKLIELQKEYRTALISEVVTGKVKIVP